MTRFLRLSAVLALCFPLLAGAQLLVRPLGADPSRGAYAPPRAPAATPAAHRTAALALPFFDDFTTPLEGLPRADNWADGGGALVNNRLPVRPLTRGVATLDGLQASGQPYNPNANPNTSDFGACDTLTSQPIDLSGLTAASRVFLSYAWQAGGIAIRPNQNGSTTPVRLDLQFRDNTGTWVRQPLPHLGTGRRTAFRQRTQAVTDPRYLHGGFQFRFLATGDRTTSTDVWNVDYIKLDANRSPADTTYVDLATGTGLSSPLRRFTAMPAYQFNAVTDTTELSRNLFTDVVNLNGGSAPTPLVWQGTVREAATSLQKTWLRFGRPLPTGAFRRDTIRGNARTARIPPGPGPRRLRYTLALDTQERDPRTLPNDTTTRTAELADYYAYDDGTPELSFSLPAVQTGAASFLAVRFDLNRPDQVQALRLAPDFGAAASRSLTAFVWADNNGRPGAVLGTVSTVVTRPRRPGQVFVDVLFRPSVPVSGTFYVGYGQPSTGQFVGYGLDANNTRPGDNFLFQQINSSGTWQPIARHPNPAGAINFPGAPLLRPVMTDNRVILGAARAAATSPNFALYPNPAQGSVRIEGPPFARARILDALGRLRYAQPATEAGQPTLPLTGLPPGLYLVRLELPDGTTATRRLVVSGE